MTYSFGEPSSYNLIQPHKCSGKDEKHVACINVMSGLPSTYCMPVRRPSISETRLTSRPKPLSFILCTRDSVIPTLRSDSNYRSFHHPQQCLLYAFSTNIPRLPIATVPASGQFVCFVYINYSGAEVGSIKALDRGAGSVPRFMGIPVCGL